jgi:viroplasmin and RNaseH domain-containing protein
MLNDVRPLYPDSTAAGPAGTVTWYAVAAGRETGIFTSWAKVEPLVSGFSGALHKSFRHRRLAEKWLAEARRQLAHVRLSNAAISSAAAAEAASVGLYPSWCAVAVGRKTGIFSSWAEV